jgi:hypothetical protein
MKSSIGRWDGRRWIEEFASSGSLSWFCIIPIMYPEKDFSTFFFVVMVTS